MHNAKKFLGKFGAPVYIGSRFKGINYTAEALAQGSTWQYLDNLNKGGNDIYFVPNVLGVEVNHKGNVRHNKNVTMCRSLFIEFDGRHQRAANFAVNPSCILTRRGKAATNYHVHWLLEHTTDVAKWRAVTCWLIDYYKSDPMVKDPCRLMRLPDFLHMKDPTNPDIYDITHDNLEQVYTLEEVAAAHGMPEDWTPPNMAREAQQDIDDNDLDTPSYIEKFKNYLESLGEVAEERNATVFKCALTAKRWGVSYQTSFDITFEYYCENFVPFEEEEEFSIAFNKGYNNTTESAVGQSTYHHAFKDVPNYQAAPPPPPPPPPKPPAKENVDNTNIPVSRLIKHAPMGEFPNNDTLCAAIVIQCLKNPANGGFEVISTNNNVYIFRNTVWQLISDEELRRIITFLSVEAAKNGEGKKPLGSDKLSGTIKQMCAYTHEESLANKVGVCKFKPDGTVDERFDIIPMQNGLLDITTNELIPHSPQYFYVNTLPFAYDPTATCPNFLAWLQDVFAGDVEQISRMQEWFGLNLTRDTSFQKFALCKGSPRSGKGTTLKVLEHLVGKDNFCGAELYQLVSDPTLLEMSKVQTCTMGDVHTVQGNDQNKILSKIKSIVGEDEQTINRKFQTAIRCKIPAKITMAANDVPQFFDESGAFASRILLFVYRRSHQKDADTHLLSRLLQEDKGIFNWALLGLKRLLENGKFTESKVATEYMRGIREDTQPTLMFIEECLDVTTNSDHTVSQNEMYDTYKKWCFGNDRRPLAKSNFCSKLQSASGEQIVRDRGRAGRHNGAIFRGCKIIEGAATGFSNNVIPMPQAT